jgi:hypothetical protein
LNKKIANCFANSVFPTPVGHKKRKDPIGLLGSFKPALALRTAFETEDTAKFCQTTLDQR